jgi:5'-3' exonuclease
LAHQWNAGVDYGIRLFLVHSEPAYRFLLCPHWLTIRQQAPGEAEAELAYLNNAGIVDAILTDDGDAFLFGATHVIRK